MSEREQAGAACPDCREDCISWVTDGQRCGYPRHPILTQLAEREKWDRLAVEKIRVCESCFAKAITALIHETEKENPDDQ